LRTKTHTHGDVPVAMAGVGIDADSYSAYGDSNAGTSALSFDEGWHAMKWFSGK
jgi:2,3-bisphosphoglycerate-independent phosphoglycerate mutase